MSDTTRYRLERTIASGGMAQVYDATLVGERGFERRVALKRVLPEHQHDASVRRMFFDEAHIASRLHHGNIVQVIDYGLVDGAEFIVMEFVDGLDARRACREGAQVGRPLDEALAFHVVAEVAYALAHAHAAGSESGAPLGIVHRDVSPQNIMLSWDGDVKLTDFGIAASLDKLERTATGVVKGKLAYMPPEQATAGDVDPAADIYALGASLVAMLTGDPPMSAPNALARRLAGEEIELSDTLSEAAATLVRDCMATAPSARPTAEALATRAGALASARLEADARGALRAWMVGLKPEAPRRGALDDLIGLSLVSTDAEGRRFTVTRERAPAGPKAASLATSERPKRWLATILAVCVALGGVAGGALLGVRMLGSSSAIEAQTATVPRPAPAPPAATVPPPSMEAASPPPAPEPEPVADSPTTTSRSPRRAAVAAPAVPAPARSERAWLRVGHLRGAGQERVYVDGRPVGFTPNLFRVAAGPRVVEIRSVESGETVARDVVRVRADHTRAAPAVMTR